MFFNHKNGYIYGLFSGFFWAVNAALISYLLMQDIIPNNVKTYGFIIIYIAFVHDSFSAITMFIVNFKNKEMKFKINKFHFLLILSGIFAGPIGLSCYMLSIKHLGVGVATSTVAIYPVVVAIFSIIFLDRILNKKIIVAIILTVLGCIGINYYSSVVDLNLNDFKTGFLLVMICVFSWSFESLVVDYISNNQNEIKDVNSMFFIRQLSSATCYLIIIIIFLDINVVFDIVNDHLYVGIILVTSLFATLSYLLWYKAISIVGAPIGTMLNVTYCLWGVLLGYFIFGQAVNFQMMISLFLIMIGVFILLKDENKSMISERV